MLRIVATDLDGTLLGSDGRVSERTRAALVRAEAAGVVVVFVTARPIRWLSGLRDVVGAHGVVICANGAIVLDLAADRVLDSSPIPREDGLAAASALRAAIPGIVFARESLSGYGREPAFVPRIPPPANSPVAPLEALLDDGTVKILARHEWLARDAFLDRAIAALRGRLTASVSGAGALVEMSAAGVTKAATLARFADARGVAAEEVVAFGDMVNDLPMLEWAGRGVAVANAHPRVLAAADEVAPSNDEDGVATVLERLLSAP